MRQRLYGGVRGSLCKEALYSIVYGNKSVHNLLSQDSENYKQKGLISNLSLINQNPLKKLRSFLDYSLHTMF